MPPYLPNLAGFVKVIIAKTIQGNPSLFLGFILLWLGWILLDLAIFGFGLDLPWPGIAEWAREQRIYDVVIPGHRPPANSAGRVWRASASSTALIMPLSSGPKKAAATSTYSVTATRAGTSGRLRNS